LVKDRPRRLLIGPGNFTDFKNQKVFIKPEESSLDTTLVMRVREVNLYKL